MSFLDRTLQPQGNSLRADSNVQPEVALSRHLHWLHTLEKAARSIGGQGDLSEWLHRDVRNFIPHQRAISGIAQITLDSWRIDRTTQARLPPCCISGFRPWDADSHSPLFSGWISTRMVQAMTRAEISQASQLGWRDSMRAADVENVLMAGFETGCEGRFVFVKIFNTSLPLQVAAPRLFDLMPLVLSAWEQMQTTEDRLRNAIFQKWNVSHLDPPATHLSLGLLTPKESEVFKWLIRGKAPIEVAELLGKSRQTVRHQAAAIYQKLGVFGHAQLVSKFAISSPSSSDV